MVIEVVNGAKRIRRLAVFFLALSTIVAGAPIARAADEIRTVRVQFPAGASGTTLRDGIVGYASVSYLLGARAGQVMTVRLDPSNTATYFNVYGPGSGPGHQAIANSEQTPEINVFSQALPATGDYTISVYMVRAAARRNERSDYTLDISISALGSGASQGQANDAKVAGTDFNATGTVPCARYAGQPMTSCDFGVVREGGGNSAVTVFWPDGGSRVIFFEAGVPTYFDQSEADGSAEMSVGQNADLFMISIGTQRFEIPEAVILGG